MGHPNVIPGLDSRDKFVAAASSALLASVGAAEQDGQNPYRTAHLLDIAAAALEQIGISTTNLRPQDVAAMALQFGPVQGAQTTSDFPVILENILTKLVLEGFTAARPSYQKFCRIGEVTDFRSWSRIVPGMLGSLDSVNEAGEYADAGIPDGEKNTIQATRHGNIIAITPETLHNDELGYIQGQALEAGNAAQRAIEGAVYALLNGNPTLSDGNALFSSAHGNLAGTGAVPSVDTLDAARLAIGSQTAPGDSTAYLDLATALGTGCAVCNLTESGAMRSALHSTQDPRVVGMVGDIAESPRITGTSWFVFCDPAIAPVLEVAFLAGKREPKVSRKESLRTGGISFKPELAFGVGAIGWRGAYSNPGA